MKIAKTCCCTLAVTFCATAWASAKMPIIGWGSWDEKGASAERYAEARDAGFTHLTQWCTSPAEAKRLLGEAEKAGIKLIIGLGHDVKSMTDAAKEFTATAKDSPALEYYYITDEPHIRQVEAIRDCVKLYEELDPAHPCYVNLFGALCDRWTRNDVARQRKHTGCATHDEYIRRLYDVVPLKMISFDMYPVLSFKPLEVGDFRLHGQRVFLKERWYETLEATSALARERNIPMFAFALVAAHRHYPAQDYPVPTRAHLRLQQYSNLAYGAQALQCFKYAMMKEYHGYNNAPILVGGRPIPFHFAYSNVSGFTAASQTATKTLFFSVSSPTSFIMNGNSPCSSARHRQWILPPSYPTVRASPFELLAFMHIVYHITHNKTRKK